jgi:asparagine synthase (glutamine-hydrolysing)
MIENLAGQFAVAIHDERTKTLVLTHDRLGVRPLFYAYSVGAVHFSTHLADLKSVLPGLSLDEEYIADYLALGHPANERTPYTGVRRLLPGQALVVGGGWADLDSFPFIPPIEQEGSDDELVAQFRDLLRTAVVRAGSAVTGGLGAELSGGLDSSSVVGAAASQGMPIETVSIVYPRSPHADEQPWMREVVQRWGVPWHGVDGDRHPPYATPPQETLGEPTPFSTWAAGQLAQQDLYRELGIHVVLTGFGGDTVLWGDSPVPYHIANRVCGLQPRGLIADLCTWHGSEPERRSALHWLVTYGLKPAARFARGHRIASYPVLPEWISSSYARRMDLPGRSEIRRAPRCRTPADQALVDNLWDLSILLSSCREQYLRDVEFRHPLLDLPLVTFMSAIPPRLRFTPGHDRVLQRMASHDILPAVVRTRTSKSGPQQVWERGLRRNFGGSPLLDVPQLVERGYVDADAWRQAVRRAQFGLTGSQGRFEAALDLEMWLQSTDL